MADSEKFVKKAIEIVLPNEEPETVEKLAKELTDLGVSEQDDLSFVEVENCTGVIPRLKAEKLVKAWTEVPKGNEIRQFLIDAIKKVNIVQDDIVEPIADELIQNGFQEADDFNDIDPGDLGNILPPIKAKKLIKALKTAGEKDTANVSQFQEVNFLRDSIEQNISIDPARLQKLIEVLQCDIGVKDPEDLARVTIDDIRAVVSVIQARKLIDAWQSQIDEKTVGFVQEAIENVISIKPEILRELVQFLQCDIGVEMPEDLSKVEVEDIQSVIPVIQARELVAAWKSNTISKPVETTFIQKAIEKVVDIDDHKMAQLLQYLGQDLGVKNVDDLAKIEARDINNIIPSVKAWKLVAAWRSEDIDNSGDEENFIEKEIEKVISIDKRTMKDLIGVLKNKVGVTKPEDLSIVQVEDLLGVLTPIQARSLINNWKSIGESKDESSFIVNAVQNVINIDEDSMTRLVKHLHKNVGVEKPDDLLNVEVDDLKCILTPIQARVLANNWKSIKAADQDDEEWPPLPTAAVSPMPSLSGAFACPPNIASDIQWTNQAATMYSQDPHIQMFGPAGDSDVTGISQPMYTGGPMEPGTKRQVYTKDHSMLLKNQDAEGPAIYKLSTNEMKISNAISKCEIGKPVHHGKPRKTIMLLGATGSGKSTLINGMINYIYDVQWNDDYRLKLIEDGKIANQAKSQTSAITAYTIHYQNGINMDYSVTIIDTPGFGDTSGLDRDIKITEQMREFFTSPGNKGIESITAIGFVVQSSLPRLTPTQRYIFDSVISLFGKDIKNNIRLLLTFADGQKPQVISSLKEIGLECDIFFKFNNSSLYVSNEKHKDHDFDEMFWKMGCRNFKLFFDEIGQMDDKSLILTKDVLRERETIENNIQCLHMLIKQGLAQLEKLQQELQMVKTHQADIDKNKDFEYTVTEQKVQWIDLEPGIHTTNCMKCNFTCHLNCRLPNNEDKARCVAMDKEGNCKECPAKCYWNIHKNTPHRAEIQTEKVKKNSDDLRKRYNVASGKMKASEQILRQMVDDFEKIQREVLENIKRVNASLTRLGEIALKPNPLSTTDYIDTLISAEKSGGEPGWQQRVAQLERVRKQAEFMQQIENKNLDPFQKYQKNYQEAKATLDKQGEKKGFSLFKKLLGQ